MVALTSAVHFHARQTPDRPALKYEGETRGYGALWNHAARIAAMLERKGLRKGDVIAVLMKNSAAFVEIALGVSHMGGVLLPINFRLAADEVGYILEHAGAKLLFVDDELTAGAGRFEPLVVVDRAAQRNGALLAQGMAPIPAVPLASRDLFRLMYTSGTTDRPKGVIHTYENYYWKSLDHVATLQLTAQDRLLVVGPLYHVGAFDLPGLATFLVGGMLHILRDFEEALVLQSVQEERITGAWMAPVMLNRLLSFGDRAAYDRSSFKWLIGGGERTPEARIREFSGLFTHGRYIDAYGLTETCSGDTMMEPGMEIAKIGSVGRPLAHVSLEIRDDDGRVLPAGETGEICLRGPKVTTGYWRDEAKTRASFFGEWFRTGDVGLVDEDGFLYLTDRKKDMIITGGENVASSEVERVVYQLPQVSEAAVIGLPDEQWGERIVAVVVLKPGTRLDFAELDAHCRSHLARFKVPKQLVIRDSLPRNPSGKVLKRVLRVELESA